MIDLWTPTRAPAIPLPGEEVNPEYVRRVNNVLRLYFNQIDAANLAALNAASELQDQIEYEEIMGWVLS